MKRKEVAVVLFNLGGPDSRETIKPFLFNFFWDKNILTMPAIPRWILAKYISIKRSRNEAGVSYAALGNKSPLLENTQAQADALLAVLQVQQPDVDFKIHICMRYWHPMAPEVVERVKQDNPDEIILLPMYPQFSTTTTWSSLEDWQAAVKAEGLDIPTSMICCYPTQTGFVAAAADLVRKKYIEMQANGFTPRILFSAHGLPEDIIQGGDPYQWQCEKTAQAVMLQTGLVDADWQSCYQSRVGRKKWISPSTDEALHQAAKDNKAVIVFPHAFTQEHVETLVEIEEEYRHLAKEIGIPAFDRVPTVSVHKAFIEGLAAMVLARMGKAGIAPDVGGRVCPSGYCRCAMGMDVSLDGGAPVDVKSPEVVL